MNDVDIEALIREARHLREEAKRMREKSDKLVERAQKLTEKVIAHFQESKPDSK